MKIMFEKIDLIINYLAILILAVIVYIVLTNLNFQSNVYTQIVCPN